LKDGANDTPDRPPPAIAVCRVKATGRARAVVRFTQIPPANSRDLAGVGRAIMRAMAIASIVVVATMPQPHPDMESA